MEDSVEGIEDSNIDDGEKVKDVGPCVSVWESRGNDRGGQWPVWAQQSPLLSLEECRPRTPIGPRQPQDPPRQQ